MADIGKPLKRVRVVPLEQPVPDTNEPGVPVRRIEPAPERERVPSE